MTTNYKFRLNENYVDKNPAFEKAYRTMLKGKGDTSVAMNGVSLAFKEYTSIVNVSDIKNMEKALRLS